MSFQYSNIKDGKLTYQMQRYVKTNFTRGSRTNSFSAELQALRDGLNLASNLGIMNLIIEINDVCCPTYEEFCF